MHVGFTCISFNSLATVVITVTFWSDALAVLETRSYKHSFTVNTVLLKIPWHTAFVNISFSFWLRPNATRIQKSRKYFTSDYWTNHFYDECGQWCTGKLQALKCWIQYTNAGLFNSAIEHLTVKILERLKFYHPQSAKGTVCHIPTTVPLHCILQQLYALSLNVPFILAN